MSRRLYVVRVAIEAMVLAENEDEAARFEEEIVSTEDFRDISVSVWSPGEPVAEGWEPGSLVYHKDLRNSGITLEDAKRYADSNGPEGSMEEACEES